MKNRRMKHVTKQCNECGKNHNPERPHCPKCGGAMVHQERDRIYGWGCGNQWYNGCGLWIPNNPRYSKDGAKERNFCVECKDFVPHHYWIYDHDTNDFGKMRVGDWFCVKHFGRLPKGRENVQKSTPALSSPAPIASS